MPAIIFASALALCSEMIVVKRGDSIYHSKILTFYRKEPFFLEALYSEANSIPISDTKIGGLSNFRLLSFHLMTTYLCWLYFHIMTTCLPLGSFQIKDVTPTSEEEASKVKVKVRMSIHGTFFVKSATMVEKVKEMEVELPTVESMEQNTDQVKPEQPADVNMEQATTDGNAEGQDSPKSEEDMDSTQQSDGQPAASVNNSQEDSSDSPSVEKKAVSLI